ncbi:hypothetical protein DMENIID0001_014850 [Sergentomyia squamirostris]
MATTRQNRQEKRYSGVARQSTSRHRSRDDEYGDQRFKMRRTTYPEHRESRRSDHRQEWSPVSCFEIYGDLEQLNWKLNDVDKHEIKILETYRMKRKVVVDVPSSQAGSSNGVTSVKETKWVPAKAVRVTFEGTILPDYLLYADCAWRIKVVGRDTTHGIKRNAQNMFEGLSEGEIEDNNFVESDNDFPELSETRDRVRRKRPKTSFDRARLTHKQYQRQLRERDHDEFESAAENLTQGSGTETEGERRPRRRVRIKAGRKANENSFSSMDWKGLIVGLLKSLGVKRDIIQLYSHGNIIEDWVNDEDLVIVNDGSHTRIACPPRDSSALDLSIVSRDLSVFCLWSLYNNTLGSDHYPIIIEVTPPYPINNEETQTINVEEEINVSRINWRSFQETLSEKLGVIDPMDDGMEKYDIFIQAVLEAAKAAGTHVPEGCFILQYADDIVIGCESQHDQDIELKLNSACSNLHKYFGNLGLSLSPEKSEVMVLSRTHRDRSVSVQLGETPVPQVNLVSLEAKKPASMIGSEVRRLGSLGAAAEDIGLDLVLSRITEQVLARWQGDWSSGNLGRLCFSILPEIEDRPWFASLRGALSRREIVLGSRIMSNHYGLNAHLHRIGITDTPMCTGCDEYLDVDHALFRCPAYAEGRRELIGKCFGMTNSRDICASAIEFKRSSAFRAIENFCRSINLKF